MKSQQRELESQISIRMQEQGLDKISNDVCTISLKNEIVPTVEDWDALHQHVTDTGQFELVAKTYVCNGLQRTYNNWYWMYLVLKVRS